MGNEGVGVEGMMMKKRMTTHLGKVRYATVKKMLNARRPKGMRRFGGELMGLVSNTTQVMNADA